MCTEETRADGDSGAGTHGHGYRFHPERRHLLNEESRQRSVPPGPILAAAGIVADDVVVDVGAGTGFWTLPLSRLVGSDGKVYAVDVEPIMLEELTTLAREQGLANVHVVASTELTIPLPDENADAVVAGFVLHEPAERGAFVREMVRLLKPGGKLLIIDWQKWETEKGPPVEHRVAEFEARDLLTGAGTSVESLPAPNAGVYLLLAHRVR
jgi:SAM-dependent methyltransferase